MVCLVYQNALYIAEANNSLLSEVETISSSWTATCEEEAKLRAVDLTERVFAVTAKEEDSLLEVALHYARRVNKAVLIFDSDKTTFRN